MDSFMRWIFLYAVFSFVLIGFIHAKQDEEIPDKRALLHLINCTKHQDCIKNSECKFGPTSTNQGTCRCRNGYFLSDNGVKCELRKLGSPCRQNDDCAEVPKTECRRNSKNNSLSTPLDSPTKTHHGLYCMCKKGYKSNSESHCVWSGVGSECDANKDCVVGDKDSVCKLIPGHRRICQCKLGFLAIDVKNMNQTCLDRQVSNQADIFCLRRKLGFPCEVDSDCNKAIKYSQCVKRKVNQIAFQDECDAPKVCSCPEHHRPAGRKTFCRKMTVGDACLEPADCSGIGGAVCNMTCQCTADFRPGLLRGEAPCVKKTIGDNCTESEDCRHVNNGTCWLNSTCQCKDGFFEISNGSHLMCQRRQIGQNCSKDTDCGVSQTHCTRGMCRCRKGLMASPDLYTCKKMKLNFYCLTSRDCGAAVTNSECRSHQCKCLKGYVSNGPLRCRKLKIDSWCPSYGESCSYAVNNSNCIQKGSEGWYWTCSCDSGYYPSDERDRCILRKLGDGCVTNTDCFDAVDNSRCTNITSVKRECHCQVGFKASEENETCTKRQLNDSCTRHEDCSTYTPYSSCQHGVCQCRSQFEPFNSSCVWNPQRLYEQCTFNAQCQRLDTNSSCVKSRCLCSNVTFADAQYKTCLPLPSQIGSACGDDGHCLRVINDSLCMDGVCQCKQKHFASEDLKLCPHEPTQLGDYCFSGILCKDYLDNTVCNASSCVCRYGYRNISNTVCKERPRLKVYRHYVQSERAIPCKDNVCQDWTNSTCTGPVGQKMCMCNFRTALQPGTSECVAAQTYQMQLKVAEEADVYDYKPFKLGLSHDAKQTFVDRLILNGVQKLFEKSELKERYLSSEVKNIIDTRWRGRRSTDHGDSGGVNVLLLVHITADYLNAEKTETIFTAVQQQLNMTGGTIGNSGLRVRRPFKDSVIFSDFNECQEETRNDCAKEANCINTLGSFMCVCKPSFVDVEDSLDYAVRGKQCKAPEEIKDLSSNRRDDNKEIAIIVLVLFVLTILVFIVYEIIKRKKSFNARALYAKFGTTKIRKLQKASMRRLKEKKKRMKEESKKRREKHRTKKEKMKKDGAIQKTDKLEAKKKKAEEKKERKQDAADKRKAKKERKKSKGKMIQLEETGASNLPIIELTPVPSTTSIDMPNESVELEVEQEASTPTPLSPYDNLQSGITTPATPYDNLFMYYPVASPDPQFVDDWNLQESQESPV